MTTPASTLGLPRITVERVRLPIQTSADPTATPPAFALVAAGATPSSPDWVPGTWEGTWAPAGWLDAISPTLVGDGAEVERGVGRWTVWARFTVGAETPARAVGYVDIT
jgi:hypothetical protein